MRFSKGFSSDRGNALLEGVGFAAVAFGLILSSGLYLFDIQLQSLELSSIARNAMRGYLLNPDKPIDKLVALEQQGTILEQSRLAISFVCGGTCSAGDQVTLEVSSENLTGRAFGVISE